MWGFLVSFLLIASFFAVLQFFSSRQSAMMNPFWQAILARRMGPGGAGATRGSRAV